MGTLHTVLPVSLTEVGEISTGETILFAIVALVTIGCGIGLLTAKRAVSAAVNMIIIMICLAVLYIANEAPFLGITQVVVYTGAVMTLVLFVVMLVGVGGDEPVSGAGSALSRGIIVLLGLGLAALLGSVVLRSTFPAARGLDGGDAAAPANLAVALFGEHVVAMELTGLLLIVAATGALTLTHRQRIRAKVTQASSVAAKMKAYASKGTHPGQKPMSGVYASTNSAAAPALSAQGEALDASVPRVLRARGLELELHEVSPEYAAAQREGRIRSREDANVARSGMPAMPGAPAPAVVQPVAGQVAQLPSATEEPAGEPVHKEEEK